MHLCNAINLGAVRDLQKYRLPARLSVSAQIMRRENAAQQNDSAHNGGRILSGGRKSYRASK